MLPAIFKAPLRRRRWLSSCLSLQRIEQKSLQRPDLSDRVVDPLQISELGEAPQLCARYCCRSCAPGIVNVRRYWPRLRRARWRNSLRLISIKDAIRALG
jgi:hypothetical protein